MIPEFLIRPLVDQHRQKIVDIFLIRLSLPLEKGGGGGFKIGQIPLFPPLLKGEVKEGHLEAAPKGPPLPGEVPEEA